MRNIIDKIFHRNVSRHAARDIVRNSLLPAPELFQVIDKAMPQWQLYNNWGDEPCWYVTIPNDSLTIQSTTVAIVSKKSGKILTITSANDEG